MRRFKRDKKFKPVSVDEGDECFPNGIFVFNITKLTNFIKSNPEMYPVEEAAVNTARGIPSQYINEATVQSADLSAPIILAEITPDRYSLIDKHHRVERAHREGKSTIPAYRVPAEQHMAFLTSEKGYATYIEYWNSKIPSTRTGNRNSDSLYHAKSGEIT